MAEGNDVPPYLGSIQFDSGEQADIQCLASDNNNSNNIPSFDANMKTYQKGEQQDGKSSSPLFTGFDGHDPSSFYRPPEWTGANNAPVWTGANNAADGLLGCQAPAADGLEAHPAEPTLQELEAAALFREAGAVRPLPRFPTEIHLQIIEHVIGSSKHKSCSFCYLFQLSTLSRVSQLYHQILQPHLYSAVNLNFNSSIKAAESLTHHFDDRKACNAHLRLASKRHQLEIRVPLLVRTLTARPDIAASVRRLILPAGGTQTYLTCTLEKTLLPDLIRHCPNLEEVDGVDSLLARQFFSGEHYCFDGQATQQHGMFAKTLHEKTSLRHFRWNGGNAAGSDFGGRVWDRHPEMKGVGFVGAHKHWELLEHLDIRDVWNLDAEMVQGIITQLPRLKKVALVGIRKKRAGRGDSATILAALEALPDTVTDVEIGNTADEEFLPAVGEWLRYRHTAGNPIQSLRLTQVPVTVENLRIFFSKLAVRRRGFYLPLLDFGAGWWGGCAAVTRLAVDNAGFEKVWEGEICGDAGMELQGLEQLEWRVRGAGGLGEALRRGWFAELKTLGGVESDDEEVMFAAGQRYVRVV
jgi:hypothetical protein